MTTPANMRCIEINEPGSADVLQIGHRPVPEPGANEVLIRVAAAGVNRPDVMQRQGDYPPPPGASDIPGLEVAGEIIAVGTGVSRWTVGQQVCALLTGGGYSEYAIAHQDLCLPIPEPLDLIQAAAMPETFFTVWRNVFQRGALQPGEVFLVHGGTSGIGTTAIQMAKAMGARVFATAGSDEKCRRCEELGAEAAFNYREQDFVSAIKEHTDNHGADVILDMVAGDYVRQNIRAAAFRGRLVSIADIRGSKVEINMLPIMIKQLVLTGSTLRASPVEEKAEIASELLQHVWPLLENAVITPVIAATFPLENAADAHRLMESNQHIGKIVLKAD